MEGRHYLVEGKQPAVHEDACVSGESTLIGCNGSVSKSTIGAGSLVAMGPGIPAEYQVPPESFARGAPTRITPLSEADLDRTTTDEEYDEYEMTDCHESLFDR